MNDFNQLMQEVKREMKAVKIPVSSHISPDVKINTRAKKRFGCCIQKGSYFTIELSDRLLNAPEKSCRQTLAHELIHTCPGCYNHGEKFLYYAAIMNRTYGYSIKRTNSGEELGLKEQPREKNIKYILQCEKCGNFIMRERYSNVIKYPSRYRCRCGGKLLSVTTK